MEKSIDHKKKIIFFLCVVFFVFFAITILNNNSYKDYYIDSGEKDKIELRANEKYINKNENAKFTIVEYFDFDCVYCRMLHLSKERREVNFQNMNYIIRNLPVNNFELAARKSIVGECVYVHSGIGAYNKFIDEYYGVWGDKYEEIWYKELAYNITNAKDFIESCVASDKELEKNLEQNFSNDMLNTFNTVPLFVIYDKDGNFVKKFGGLGAKSYKAIVEHYNNM